MICAIVPLIDRDAANAAMEAIGYGPNNFNVPLKTEGVVTHYASVHREDVYPGFPPSVVVQEGALADVAASMGLAVA